METMQFELKTKGDSGSFEGIMSAPTLDRDDEIVDSKAFEPLPEHITIDIDHGLTVEKTVGSGVPFYDTNGILRVKGTFASTPLGQLTRTLVKEGHIRHMSVAFRGAVREVDEVDGKQHVRKGELINCTITGIPSNTATALVAKVGARNSAKDAERIQNTHDHMVELGATCGEKCVHGPAAKAADDVIIHAMDGSTRKLTTDHFLSMPGISVTSATPLTASISGVTFADNKVVVNKSADTEPPASVPASAGTDAGAQVEVARALARLALARAALALE